MNFGFLSSFLNSFSSALSDLYALNCAKEGISADAIILGMMNHIFHFCFVNPLCLDSYFSDNDTRGYNSIIFHVIQLGPLFATHGSSCVG